MSQEDFSQEIAALGDSLTQETRSLRDSVKQDLATFRDSFKKDLELFQCSMTIRWGAMLLVSMGLLLGALRLMITR